MEAQSLFQVDDLDNGDAELKSRRTRKNRKRDAMENLDENSFDETFEGAPKKRYVGVLTNETSHIPYSQKTALIFSSAAVKKI